MQENSQCSVNANIRTRSLNSKHMEFIYHWKKIEGKKKKILILKETKSWHWMVVAPLVLSHKGSTLAQEQMPSFLGQRSVLPHSHDQRSPHDTGYPEAASHVLLLFHKPGYLPGCQHHAPLPGLPSSLTLLRFQNTETKIDSSSLRIFLGHRYSATMAEKWNRSGMAYKAVKLPELSSFRW